MNAKERRFLYSFIWLEETMKGVKKELGSELTRVWVKPNIEFYMRAPHIHESGAEERPTQAKSRSIVLEGNNQLRMLCLKWIESESCDAVAVLTILYHSLLALLYTNRGFSRFSSKLFWKESLLLKETSLGERDRKTETESHRQSSAAKKITYEAWKRLLLMKLMHI